jgi:hypothetical protein
LDWTGRVRKSVYLDSTVPSYYHDERMEIMAFIATTRSWWDRERHRYDLFTSDYTLIELNRGAHGRKPDILRMMDGIQAFPTDDEIDRIAEVYMREYVMPKGAAGDAFHLACASLHKVDYLLTWNCNHLANANKDQHMRVVNARLELFTPKIVTPIQLFREKD